MKKIIPFLIFPLLIVGCAQEFYTSFKEPVKSKKYGSLIVKFSTAVQGVNVTLDDKLVAKDKHTEWIEINNIPVGKHEVNVIAASGNLESDIDVEQTVTIEPNQQSTVLVQVPPASTGYWLYLGIVFAATLLFI